MTTTGTEAYLRTQVLTAPPEKLQLMLYEGAIRFARQGKEKMIEKNYEASFELLVRAENIVLELICGLRPDVNPDLCGKLSAVYSFIYRKLVEANMSHDTSAIDAATEVLTIQRDIWLQLLDKLARERAAEASAEPVGA